MFDEQPNRASLDEAVAHLKREGMLDDAILSRLVRCININDVSNDTIDAIARDLRGVL